MTQPAQQETSSKPDNYATVMATVFREDLSLFPPGSNPTGGHIKMAQAFEYYVSNKKNITERRQIWAADSFETFSLAYLKFAVEIMSCKDANKKKYVHRPYLQGMKEHVEWCGRKLVPGFEGDVVARWQEKMDELVEDLLKEFKYGKA